MLVVRKDALPLLKTLDEVCADATTDDECDADVEKLMDQPAMIITASSVALLPCQYPEFREYLKRSVSLDDAFIDIATRLPRQAAPVKTVIEPWLKLADCHVLRLLTIKKVAELLDLELYLSPCDTKLHKPVDQEDLIALVRGSLGAVIYFEANECDIKFTGFDELHKLFPTIAFARINLDEIPVPLFGIKHVPTLRFYERGSRYLEMVGMAQIQAHAVKKIKALAAKLGDVGCAA